MDTLQLSDETAAAAQWVAIVTLIGSVGFWVLSSLCCCGGRDASGPWADKDTGLRVTQLVVYPIKGCKGTPLQEALVDGSGFAHDRRFMIVNSEGAFQTQRQLPRMCLITPALTLKNGTITGVTLSAPGSHDLVVEAAGIPTQASPVADAAPTRGAPVTVKVWGQAVEGAVDQGSAAATWLTTFLEEPGLRLVFMGPRCVRPLKHKRGKFAEPGRETTGAPAATTSFADMYPFLVATGASLRDLVERLAAQGDGAVGMERFRANIVVDGPTCDPWEEDTWRTFSVGGLSMHGVKRCVRCRVPTVDPATGDMPAGKGRKAAEPLQLLRDVRRGATASEGCFGVNAMHEIPSQGGVAALHTVRVGDVVKVHQTGPIGPL